MGTKIDTPTDQHFIPAAVFSTTCLKHEASRGEPCFEIPAGASRVNHYGICNTRAIQAGYDGKIDPRSMAMPPKRNKQAA